MHQVAAVRGDGRALHDHVVTDLIGGYRNAYGLARLKLSAKLSSPVKRDEVDPGAIGCDGLADHYLR